MVGWLQYSQVSRSGDAPGGILHVVALAVNGPIFVREAEGGLYVRAHVGEERLLDGDPLHLAAHLGGAEGKPRTGRDWSGGLDVLKINLIMISLSVAIRTSS